MIKILIADDQELIRQSLMIILNSEADFQVTDAEWKSSVPYEKTGRM